MYGHFDFVECTQSGCASKSGQTGWASQSGQAGGVGRANREAWRSGQSRIGNRAIGINQKGQSGFCNNRAVGPIGKLQSGLIGNMQQSGNRASQSGKSGISIGPIASQSGQSGDRDLQPIGHSRKETPGLTNPERQSGQSRRIGNNRAIGICNQSGILQSG